MPEYWEELQGVTHGMQPAPAGTREEIFEAILAASRAAAATADALPRLYMRGAPAATTEVLLPFAKDVAVETAKDYGALMEMSGVSGRPSRPPMFLRPPVVRRLGSPPHGGGPGSIHPAAMTEREAQALAFEAVGGAIGAALPVAGRALGRLGERLGLEAAPPSARALGREAYETRKAELTPEPEPMAPVAEAPATPRVLRSMRPELGAATTPPQTPAFKRWFGEPAGGASMKDLPRTPEGEPMVVYHSTVQTFDDPNVFKPEKGELGTHVGTLKAAEQAGTGMGLGRTYPLYTNIRNPLRLTDQGLWGFDSLRQRPDLFSEGELRSAAETGRKGLGPDATERALQGLVQSKGYDGIVYVNRREGMESLASMYDRLGTKDHNVINAMSDDEFLAAVPEASDSYIVFDATQMKSAIGNIGTYDPTKPNILRSMRPKLGAPTAPPQTPAFKRFISESKVLDEKGVALKVYHGTPGGRFSDAARRRNKGLEERATLNEEKYSYTDELYNLSREQRASEEAISELWPAANRAWKDFPWPKTRPLFPGSDRLLPQRPSIEQLLEPIGVKEIEEVGPLKFWVDAKKDARRIDARLGELEGRKKAINARLGELPRGEKTEPEEVFRTWSGGTTDWGYRSSGAYFTDDLGEATRYAESMASKDPHVYEVYLSIKNPYVEGETKAPAGMWEEFNRRLDRVRKGYARPWRWLEEREREQAILRRQVLQKYGFDGEVWKQANRTEYVVFEPTQIKSATENIGTYDPTDPSILRSMKPETGAAPATTPAAKDLEAGRKEALAYIDHPGFERRMVSRLKEMGMSKDDATVAFDRARARVESTPASVVDPEALPEGAEAVYTPAAAMEGLGPAHVAVSRESTAPAYDSFHEFMHAAQDDEGLIDFMNEAGAFDFVTTPMGQRPYFATEPTMGLARAFGDLLVDAVGAIPKQRKRGGPVHQISPEQAGKISSGVREEMERIPGAPEWISAWAHLRTRPELGYIGSPNEAHVAMIQMRRDMLSEGFIKDQYEVIGKKEMGDYLSRNYESLPSEVKTLRPYLTSKNLTTFTRAFNKVPAVVAAWSATKQSKEKPRQR